MMTRTRRQLFSLQNDCLLTIFLFLEFEEIGRIDTCTTNRRDRETLLAVLKTLTFPQVVLENSHLQIPRTRTTVYRKCFESYWWWCSSYSSRRPCPVHVVVWPCDNKIAGSVWLRYESKNISHITAAYFWTKSCERESNLALPVNQVFWFLGLFADS